MTLGVAAYMPRYWSGLSGPMKPPEFQRHMRHNSGNQNYGAKNQPHGSLLDP